MPTPEQAMEYIWSKIPKQEDGTIRYLKGDIKYLYDNGFVDSRKYSFSQWQKAFENFKQPDGNYKLKKEDFIPLHAYREVSPLKYFDALKIKDGPWSDDELKKLYQDSIVPVSNIKESSFFAFTKTLKEHGLKDNNNHLMLNEDTKKALNELLEEYPSPRTKLDHEIKRIKAKNEKTLVNQTKNRDQSGFSVGDKINEQATQSLKSFEGVKSDPGIQADENSESFDIKNLKKPKGKVFG